MAGFTISSTTFSNMVMKTHPLVLRPMQESDLPIIMAIEERAYPYPWALANFKDCLKHNYDCWVYEQNEHIIAYTVLMLVLDELSILNVCVNPFHQRQGLGAALLNTIENLAVERGMTNCFLEVRPSNKAALKLYQKQGFHEIGLRKRYYPAATGREDAIVMAKAILPSDSL
jgi:ribosomal-protein-alanine N-acetyltransferase